MIDVATARSSIKARLDIAPAETRFDALIDEFVLSAINRLYPIAQMAIPAQDVNVSVDRFGEAVVDLSTLTTPALAARKVEAYVFGGSLLECNDTYHQGNLLYVRNLKDSISQLKIYGLKAYAAADLPDYLHPAITYFAMSEFYDMLVGNKRYYNIYASGGARAVDNMQDQSQYYEQKANVYLNDHVTIYGGA